MNLKERIGQVVENVRSSPGYQEWHRDSAELAVKIKGKPHRFILAVPLAISLISLPYMVQTNDTQGYAQPSPSPSAAQIDYTSNQCAPAPESVETSNYSSTQNMCE